MHGSVPFGVASATEIARHESRAATKLSACKFGAVAKLLWPVKPAYALAQIAGTKVRTAERWLSGEFEPPAIVIAAVIVEITKRT